MPERKVMDKEKAKEVLDMARWNPLVPVRMVNEALITLGDIDVHTVDPEIRRSLRHNGNESIYCRSRTIYG